MYKIKPVYNKKYLETKTKSYMGKVNTKEVSPCIYISVILIESVYRKDKNFPQVLLEKYKYVVKDISSDDFDEKNSDEKVLMNKN